MNRRQLIARCGLFAVGSSGALPAYACRLFPPDSTDHYRAQQDGRDAGFQSIAFFHDDAEFVVSTRQSFHYLNDAGVRVDFSHSAREVWVNGWLNGFESSTRHGRHSSRVTAETVDDVTMLVRSTESEVPSLVTGYVVPGSLWHRDTRLVSRLMDLVDGQLKLVKAYYGGKEVLSVRGTPTVANHYQLRGEMNVDAWYTEHCQLARVAVPIKNAVPIIFELS